VKATFEFQGHGVNLKVTVEKQRQSAGLCSSWTQVNYKIKINYDTVTEIKALRATDVIAVNVSVVPVDYFSSRLVAHSTSKYSFVARRPSLQMFPSCLQFL